MLENNNNGDSSLAKVRLDNLEAQKWVLIQKLNTYKAANHTEGIVETKKKLDDVVDKIQKLRRELGVVDSDDEI